VDKRYIQFKLGDQKVFYEFIKLGNFIELNKCTSCSKSIASKES